MLLTLVTPETEALNPEQSNSLNQSSNSNSTPNNSLVRNDLIGSFSCYKDGLFTVELPNNETKIDSFIIMDRDYLSQKQEGKDVSKLRNLYETAILPALHCFKNHHNHDFSSFSRDYGNPFKHSRFAHKCAKLCSKKVDCKIDGCKCCKKK